MVVGADIVSLSQQLLCSGAGTAFFDWPLAASVQVCEQAGGFIKDIQFFSPVARDIFRAAL